MYADEKPIGLFKGFSPNPRELEVEIIIPHGSSELPRFGEFILIEMEPNKAAVGRVIHYHPTGPLTSKEGESYIAEMGRSESAFPENVRELVLRYSMTVALLGILFKEDQCFRFQPGVRSLAKLGMKVKRPSFDALKYLANAGLIIDPDSKSTVRFGNLALGTEVIEDIEVYFDIKRLKSRRSFVFARAGYGKSNLIKYLLSRLYEAPPDVGLLIFDPEGEYALPHSIGQREIPGLFSVPELRKRMSLYTARHLKQEYKNIFKGKVKVNFADFSSRAILTAFVPPEKHDQVWANWVKGAKHDNWQKLLEILEKDRYRASEDDLCNALGLSLNNKKREGNVSLDAIKNNLIPAIDRLHSPDSTLGKDFIEELKKGNIVIVDISLLSTEEGLAIAELLMQKVFLENVRSLTEHDETNKAKTLVVLEEAQSILGGKNLSDQSIFVRWVKEGRKYDLGAILITQQPGAIAPEILSQGDNFFVMHLLNQNDLDTLKRVNAHFAQDILEQIRYEPIKGNCFFWSAPDQPYVICAKVKNFDDIALKEVLSEKELPEITSASPKLSLSEESVNIINEDSELWVFKVKNKNAYAVSRQYLGNRLRKKLGGVLDKDILNALNEMNWDISHEALLTQLRGKESIVIFPSEIWDPKSGKTIQREIEIEKK